jgi:DNA-binding NarL/FixJ family response regulator
LTDEPAPVPLRVVAADDHAIVRAGIAAVLAAQPDLELLTVVGTGAEAAAAVAELRPDVLVIDLQLPDVDGVAVTRQAIAAHPRVAVLVLSMYDDEDSLFAAVRAGARGYLVKGATQHDLAAAIRSVARGEALFGVHVAQRLLDGFAGRSCLPLPELSVREREVLAHLTGGCGTQEIARRLFLSPKTVRNQISSILHKLDVPDRAQAITVARGAGLGSAT